MTVISCSQVTGITVAVQCGFFVRRAIRHGRGDSDLRDPDIALALRCNTTGRTFKDSRIKGSEGREMSYPKALQL